ncbi:MAG: sensor histidine kinase KdpD [Myxococcales bacterium]|nr:sensor histidine kinase KdpD [Myxococcales bacterium]
MRSADELARPTPEALLAVAARADSTRGRLKIFFGAAPGVGKTFAMLEAARRAQAEGLDVVLGVVETHGRNETAALLAGLPALPLRQLEHRGVGLQELDLDAALKRRPGLLLVDELAHTNAPGSRHPKRWQDVFELLAAGIDVHTTLNVQHLESLNDIVAQITWIRVRETIPDAVFDRADEVELVDLPPDTLLERLREGRVYLPEQARLAVHAFFRKGNLLALRELALRRMAQRVDSDVQAYRREHGIATLWPAGERLLVCVGPSPSGARLVRAAARIAASLRAEWIAVNVETPALALAGAAERDQIASSLRLAESLGAEVVVLVDEAVADALLRLARERNVSRIVVGKPGRARWRDRMHRSLLRALVRGSEGIDIHVITGEREVAVKPSGRPSAGHSTAAHYLWCVALVAALTTVGSLLFPYVDRSDLIMLYIVGIMLAAVRFGRGPSTATALLSVAAFDFFYVPPFFTFAVNDGQYVLTFAVMLAVGLLISTLTSRIRMQVEAARVRERRTAALYSLSRELAQLRHKVSIATCAARHIGETLGVRAAVLLVDEAGQLVPVQGTDAPLVADPRELSVARWAFEHGPAGRYTDTLPGAAATHLPLVAAGRTIGVLSVEPGKLPRDNAAAQLLETFGSQTALALHRVLLAQEAQAAELRARAEELRSSLLSSVSHDLRTPLATITGAATTLLEGGPELPREVHHDLADAIREEAERLARLVANLLDMSRLESGELVLQREWTPIEEPIGAALDRLEGRLAGREVEVQIEPGLPLVALDALLMEQLLMNLLENAIKYTPPGTPLTVTAARDGDSVVLELLDRGPGIPADALPRIFDKFVRAGGPPGTQGVGLGLAICRAVAEAHGGGITAGARPGGGAVFRVTLPIGGEAPAVPAEEASE